MGARAGAKGGDSQEKYPPGGPALLFENVKGHPGQARKVMHAIWSMGQSMFTKCIIVVEEDCDVQNIPEVILRAANNIDPERDIQFTLAPMDSLDHSAPAQLRIEDGDRCHTQVEGRRLRAAVAVNDRDGPRHQS
jgi:3-polyprenyl-4-hydroxybenzoate decarboxylase